MYAQIFVKTFEEKVPLATPTRWWEDNINMVCQWVDCMGSIKGAEILN